MFEGLKQILRPPEAKASRTSQVLAFESGGRARWTPRDYAALAREGRLMGFWHVEAGPLVRSSYHAANHRPDEPLPDGPPAGEARP